MELTKKHKHYNFWLAEALSCEAVWYGGNKISYIEGICTPEEKELLKENNTSIHALYYGTAALDINFDAFREMAKRHNNELGFKFWQDGLMTRADYELYQKSLKKRLTVGQG